MMEHRFTQGTSRMNTWSIHKFIFIKHPLHAHITTYILWWEGRSLSLCLVFKLPMQIKSRKLNIKLQCVLLLFPSFLPLPSVQIEQLHSGGRNRSWLPDRLCNLSVHYDHTKWEQCSPSVFQHESPCIAFSIPFPSSHQAKRWLTTRLQSVWKTTNRTLWIVPRAKQCNLDSWLQLWEASFPGFGQRGISGAWSIACDAKMSQQIM